MIINTTRSAYSTEQLHNPTTIRELIDHLECLLEWKELTDDEPIYLAFDNGYTYGNIDLEQVYTLDEWDELQNEND